MASRVKSGDGYIKVNISKSDLKALNNSLKKQTDVITEGIITSLRSYAEGLRDEAQSMYLDANYPGENDVTVNVEKTVTGFSIIAEGDALPFIEYGAGDGNTAWYFSTDGKNIQMDGDQPRAGQWVRKRSSSGGPSLFNESELKMVKKAIDDEEELYRSPKGNLYTNDDIYDLVKKNMDKEGKRYKQSALIKRVEAFRNKSQKYEIETMQNALKRSAKSGNVSTSDGDEYRRDAVRTYGNKPHHIMSRIREMIVDHIDTEYVHKRRKGKKSK